jgi:hypothetical protein
MNDCVPKTEKLVPSELSRLSTHLEELRERVDDLEEKLAPVLSTPTPEAGGPPCDSNPGCVLADEIAGHRRRVAGLSGRVLAIIDRLEV